MNRILCYCDDCQAYVHHLGRADLLDAQGGSDIVQVAPSSVSFDRGSELIAGVRLSHRGLHRWYASCCKTPLGNTPRPVLPVIGFITEVLQGATDARPVDEVIGPPHGRVFGKAAIGEPPPGSERMDVLLVARILRKVLGWKIGGKTWPHPFFDRASEQPKYPVTVLSRAERDALRPLCGPRPARA